MTLVTSWRSVSEPARFSSFCNRDRMSCKSLRADARDATCCEAVFRLETVSYKYFPHCVAPPTRDKMLAAAPATSIDVTQDLDTKVYWFRTALDFDGLEKLANNDYGGEVSFA